MISSTELAKICGVSQGTVDRAIHNRPGISPKTRERILAAAEAHGYRPNPIASELLRGTSRIVGGVVPETDSLFFMDAMAAIRTRLHDDNLRLHISPVSDKEEFNDALEEFAVRRSKALLVFPPEQDVAIPKRIHRMTPTLAIVEPCADKATPCLMPDEIRTGQDAVSYLHTQGHRNILHRTANRQAAAIQGRTSGYQKKMQELNLEPRVITDENDEELIACVKSKEVTAIFCHNDWLALLTIRALNAAGFQVPDDVSVLGVDNTPTFIALFPTLTTMTYPLTAMADRIADWLIPENKLDSSPLPAMPVVERQTVKTIHTK
jgi:DNA-binding LacI/PurR family transcriptional regulator